MAMRLWGRATSHNVQKVLWAMAEMGLEAERIDAGGHHGGLDTDEFRAMNPNGRVPVLEDDGLVLYESHAITRHLARLHGSGTLLPDDETGLALADQWMDWCATTLVPAFVPLFWEAVRKPPSQRGTERLSEFSLKSGEIYRIVDARLAASPFLAGPRLTMGDIPVAATLYRYFDMAIERPALPALERWYEALAERPAYRSTIMTDYSSLAGRD